MMEHLNGVKVTREDVMSEGMTSESERGSIMDSPPPQKAHDFDRWQSSIGLKGFGKGLNAAARAVFPMTARQGYSNVYVLMMVWEEDAVPSEVRKLLATFDNIFNFNVELYKIPGIYSQDKLDQRVEEFVTLGQNSEENLKIVYHMDKKRAGFPDDGERIR
jgi:hypothetical protein